MSHVLQQLPALSPAFDGSIPVAFTTPDGYRAETAVPNTTAWALGLGFVFGVGVGLALASDQPTRRRR